MSEKLRLRGLFLSEQGVTVEGDVLRNVVLLGPTSTNGTQYSDDAMRSAVPFYEGRAVYCDHDLKSKSRKLHERFGHAENVRFVESDHDGRPRVRGDVHFLRSHPMSGPVVESYQKGRPYFGMSHVADGLGTKEGKRKLVEQLTSVTSLDLVDRAATGTLVEQEDGEGEMPMPADPAQAMKDGLVQMVSAIINDDSITPEDKKKKIGALIDAHGDVNGGGAAPPELPMPEDGGASESPMSEQARDEYKKKLGAYFAGLVEQKTKEGASAVAALSEQVTALTQKIADLAEQASRKPAPKYLKPAGSSEPAAAGKNANGAAPPASKDDRKKFLYTP